MSPCKLKPDINSISQKIVAKSYSQAMKQYGGSFGDYLHHRGVAAKQKL